MGKRKREEEDYDYLILKKLRKLEKKLKKRRISSESESESEEEQPPFHQDNSHNEVVCLEEDEDYPLAQAVPDKLQQCNTVPTEPVMSLEDKENSQPKEPEDTDLPLQLQPEILQLLGEDPLNQVTYGENLHKDIAPRWINILLYGLRKEEQTELVKRYPTPENCPSLQPPKLNPEIKAALAEINTKQDSYSLNKQAQLASGISAIGKVLTWTLQSQNVPQEIIKTLSDAGRLLCDSHHRESLTRRFSALNSLNKNIRDTIKNTKIDTQLFGSSLSEHIKSSKAISRTGSELRPTPRPTYRTPAASQPQRGSLNSRGAPRAAVAEPRSTPANRRPPRDRRQDATRGRRSTTNYTRQRTRKR